MLKSLYRYLRYHPAELLNPHLNLRALKPIQVKVISKDYEVSNINSSFTVVVVVRNEADSISGLLKSIETQTLAPSQVFVIDGGSTDDTVKILNNYKKNSKLPLSIYIMPSSTISEGANFGIANSSTELIITLHAGCVLGPNCFANLVGPISTNSKIDLVGGIYHPQHQNPEKYLVPDWNAIDWDNFIPSSRICCFKKSIATQAGLFASDLIVGEDTYFFVQYRSHSKYWVINRSAYLYWDSPDSLDLHDRVLYKYAVGDGISGLGNYLYYSHYRNFEGSGVHNKDIYIKGYKAGHKQRLGHLFYKEKIKGILIIFSNLMMYQNRLNYKLLSLINAHIAKRWHIIYLSPTLREDIAKEHQPIYLPIDLTKIDLLPIETYSPSSIKSYLSTYPVPVKIVNNYKGLLWKYKAILTKLLYPAIIKKL